MRKLPLIFIALLIAVSCSSRPESNEQHAFASDFEDDEEYEVVEEYGESDNNEASYEKNNPRGDGTPWINTIGRYDEVFNDSNYIQYESAEKLGIDPIETLYEAYNTSRPLVRIESGANYKVDKLTHSMPYLVPEAAALLDEIGRDFGNMVKERGGDPKNNKIIVTSLLRSPHSVKKLRRVNRNAVDSSTHMFATTFDISWNNFYYPDSSKRIDGIVLKGILAEVLNKKRNDGKCWVKFEKKTPCFHITVRK